MESISQALQSWIHETSPTALAQVDSLVHKITNLCNGGVQNQNAFMLTAATTSIFALYLATVRHLRYKNINAIREKYPNPQDVLDNIDIAREINAITVKKEFPCKHGKGFIVKDKM